MDEARTRLRDALDSRYVADQSCRAALDGGAALHLQNGTVPAPQLVEIYRRRVEHLRRLGAETIGSDDLMERLAETEGALRLASVDSDELHFVVFVNPDNGDVVASWGVPSRHRGTTTSE